MGNMIIIVTYLWPINQPKFRTLFSLWISEWLSLSGIYHCFLLQQIHCCFTNIQAGRMLLWFTKMGILVYLNYQTNLILSLWWNSTSLDLPCTVSSTLWANYICDVCIYIHIYDLCCFKNNTLVTKLIDLLIQTFSTAEITYTKHFISTCENSWRTN